MARPTVSVYVATSLDGFIARPNGDIDWLETGPPAEGDYGFQAFFDTVDTLVMGRRTFEKVLAFGVWPYQGKRVVVLSAKGVEVPAYLAERVQLSSLAPGGLVQSLANTPRVKDGD